MIRFNQVFMLGVVSSLAVGTPVFAQEDDGFLLEEIIVTARKREERLQEVPVSISVLSDGLIEETGILTQEGLFQLVTAFVDGMPILGSQDSLGFGG